ncbi:MAG: class I SAM-dependent methyltransferase [Candidatus Thorarchaeota archaeon]
MDDALLIELYKDIPKLGTGSPITIRQVFSKLQLKPKPSILDVGCATGMTSIELAQISDGSIVSLDSNQTYLDILNERAKAQNVSDRIRTTKQDLFTMDFEDGTFDVIWAENVIFGIGLEGALKSWRPFLKPDGYLVFSVIVKMKDIVPDNARNYWERVYPAVKNHAEIVDLVDHQHYRLIDTILIPTSETMEYCYLPLEKKIRELRETHPSNKAFIDYLDLNQEEIDIVRKYDSEFYGSVIYIIQK